MARRDLTGSMRGRAERQRAHPWYLTLLGRRQAAGHGAVQHLRMGNHHSDRIGLLDGDEVGGSLR